MTREANDLPTGGAQARAAGVFPQPGDLFDGKYRIERTLGQGAMAIVLAATHLQLEDRVAIKLLLPQWAERPELVERFMREGRAATRIRSEHVVRVFDVGVVDAQPYLVMEYLEGSDLDRVLETDGPLPVSVAVDYLLQASEAIAEAHARGIVHRDLKPANLFLTRRADGSSCVKVLDFGISKAPPSALPDTRMTEPAAIMGSPHYMSPEQMVSSTDVDARSDVWALGAILHELLVGAPAFNGETMAALSASVLRDGPPPLTSLRADVAPALEAVVLRCLEKEPARRFANVADLAQALAGFGSAASHASAERIARVLEAGTGKVSLPVAPLSSRVRAASMLEATNPPRRPRGRVLGYVVAAIAIVAIGSGIARMVVRNERASREAEARRIASAASVTLAANTPSTPTPPAPPTHAAGSVTTTNAQVSAPAPTSTPNAMAANAPAPVAKPVARPAVHARGPRRTPRPASHAPPPLPDFPVPSVDPQGEPSSRPVLSPLPSASSSASAPSIP